MLVCRISTEGNLILDVAGASLSCSYLNFPFRGEIMTVLRTKTNLPAQEYLDDVDQENHAHRVNTPSSSHRRRKSSRSVADLKLWLALETKQKKSSSSRAYLSDLQRYVEQLELQLSQSQSQLRKAQDTLLEIRQSTAQLTLPPPLLLTRSESSASSSSSTSSSEEEEDPADDDLEDNQLEVHAFPDPPRGNRAQDCPLVSKTTHKVVKHFPLVDDHFSHEEEARAISKKPRVVPDSAMKLARAPEQRIRRARAPKTLVPQLCDTNLGPAQHQFMLTRLRFIKSVMHELPWAKSQLREMLLSYTQKQLSKHEMLPRLSHLSDEVTKTLNDRAQARARAFTEQHRLNLSLSIAQEGLNELKWLKFGRRGKPHSSALCYNVHAPNVLKWRTKQGLVHKHGIYLSDIQDIQIWTRGSDRPSAVFQRALKKKLIHRDALESAVTLVTKDRTLNLVFPSSIHRDWCLNQLEPIMKFAQDWIEFRTTSESQDRVLRRRESMR